MLGLLALPILLAAGELDYTSKAPLSLRQISAAEVRDITYINAAGTRTRAYLVSPPGKAKCAGVLFVHWYEGGAPTSNRTQFLGEALMLAEKGTISLLIETMWTPADWFVERDPARDYDSSVAQVKELRRALDVLLAQSRVDPQRVAYVGHDFGAMYGAVMAGVDKRPKAWALQAGTASFSDWFLLYPKVDGESKQKVIDRLAPLDPVKHIAAAAPAPVLFQFATEDRFVPEAKAKQFFDAALEPKQILWYKCGHEMNEKARNDRVAWLTEKLALAGAK